MTTLHERQKIEPADAAYWWTAAAAADELSAEAERRMELAKTEDERQGLQFADGATEARMAARILEAGGRHWDE
jgi:hypothetical protein